MKKILLASTALLAFGALSAAQAAEPIKLSVGGFMKQQLIYGNNQDYMHYNNFDEMGFGQVNFSGATKLDNGIEVAVQVETLATQWNDSRNASGARNAATGSRSYGNSDVRRAYMTVSSAFGQAVLGQREDFGFITGVSAPDVGWGNADGDWGNVIINPSHHAGVNVVNNSRYNSRADKLTVITPTWEGFAVGFSYTPDIRQSWTGDLTQGSSADGVSAGTSGVNTVTNANALINRADFGGDMYLGGISYKNTLGPVAVKSNFDFGQYNIGNMRTYQGGLQATYAGFTVGGSIFARNIGDKDHVTLGTGSAVYSSTLSNAMLHTGMSWDAGVGYAVGPYAVSLGYFHDTTKRDGSGAVDSFGGAADSTQVYTLSGKYTMGPGVEWRNSLYYVDYKNNNNNFTSNDTNNASTSNDGVAFITGLQVTF